MQKIDRDQFLCLIENSIKKQNAGIKYERCGNLILSSNSTRERTNEKTRDFA